MRRIVSVFIAWCSLAAAQVHKVPVASQWYPAEGKDLEKLLDQAWAVSARRTGTTPPRKGLAAIIAPHAALPFSGVIAASAYRKLDRPKNVILLAFSHRRRIEGVAVPALEAYETPLGPVRLNREALRELKFPARPEAELCDHSLENQLPFIRRAAPEAGLIPLYVGDLTPDELAAAARKLAGRVARGDVIVASSDFTHYGESYGYQPFPNDAELPKRLMERALAAFERVGALDVPAFDRWIAATRDTLCGWAPIRLLMATLDNLKEDVYATPLDFMTSGDLTKDYSTSVSYGALAFYPGSAYSVGERSRQRLLASARRTLDEYLGSGKKVPFPVPQDQRDPELEQRGGVFVTIRKHGELRGCIGTITPAMPLWEAVADRTLAAAAEDPRFKPVTRQDGPVSLEISLLTPLRKLKDWREFQLGEGALIALDGKSGILLPQVAQEMHWNREQFLENLARKAGLDPKSYRNPKASLYVYSAQVFAEQAAAGDGR